MVRQCRHGRGEHDTHPKTDTYTMRKEELVVFGRDGGHHQAEHVDRAACGDERVEVSRIEEWTGGTAEQWAEAELNGTDPGDRGRR